MLQYFDEVNKLTEKNEAQTHEITINQNDVVWHMQSYPRGMWNCAFSLHLQSAAHITSHNVSLQKRPHE